jgi:hypothetical protein
MEDQGEQRITYQIKLYKEGNNIKVNVMKECDYYVICLKELTSNDISVHVLTYNEIITDNFAVSKRGGDINNIDRNIIDTGTTRYVYLNSNKIKRNDNNSVVLPISGLDSLIKDCAGDLKMIIDEVYEKLSDLHYDIDSLITGVDKNNTEITSDNAEKSALNTITEITEYLGQLTKGNY